VRARDKIYFVILFLLFADNYFFKIILSRLFSCFCIIIVLLQQATACSMVFFPDIFRHVLAFSVCRWYIGFNYYHKNPICSIILRIQPSDICRLILAHYRAIEALCERSLKFSSQSVSASISREYLNIYRQVSRELCDFGSSSVAYRLSDERRCRASNSINQKDETLLRFMPNINHARKE